jgi:hypothetical protein
MIIDCHGHYTTAPKALELFRKAQIAALTDPKAPARSIQISDDEVRETLVPAQLKLQQERGTDIAIFSPGAGKMAHHRGTGFVAKKAAAVQAFHRRPVLMWVSGPCSVRRHVPYGKLAIPTSVFADRIECVPAGRQSAPAPPMPDGRCAAHRCFRARTGSPH